MLRFEVQDEDMFGEPNFIGQAVYPVSIYRLDFRYNILTYTILLVVIFSFIWARENKNEIGQVADGV